MPVRIIKGDCLTELAKLPDQSVNCCVTSPPYWGLRDYGVVGQLGLESTPAEYVEKMVAVFREVRRVLRDDGTLWLNLGDSYASNTKGTGGVKSLSGGGTLRPNGRSQPQMVSARMDYGSLPIKSKDLVGIPWRVAFALQADGWYLRQDIIWAKPNPMPESVRDRCTKSHEYLFLLAKSERYYYDADAIAEPFADKRMGSPGGGERNYAPSDRNDGTDSRILLWNADGAIKGRNRRTVWTIATQPFKEAHFATFPPAPE